MTAGDHGACCHRRLPGPLQPRPARYPPRRRCAAARAGVLNATTTSRAGAVSARLARAPVRVGGAPSLWQPSAPASRAAPPPAPPRLPGPARRTRLGGWQATGPDDWQAPSRPAGATTGTRKDRARASDSTSGRQTRTTDARSKDDSKDDRVRSKTTRRGLAGQTGGGATAPRRDRKGTAWAGSGPVQLVTSSKKQLKPARPAHEAGSTSHLRRAAAQREGGGGAA